MDPYYRTLDGLVALVRKDFTGFGHMFAKRGRRSSEHESSPVFLQWIDCLWQLTEQFPTHFEYNESFLLFLVTASSSNFFLDFRHDCEQELVSALADAHSCTPRPPRPTTPTTATTTDLTDVGIAAVTETAVTEEGETKKGGGEAKECGKEAKNVKDVKNVKEGAGEAVVSREEVSARSLDNVVNHHGNRKHWTNPLYAMVVEPGRNGTEEERDGRDGGGEGGEGGEGGGRGFTRCARLRPSWNVIHLNLWKRLHLRSLPSPATLTMGPYVLNRLFGGVNRLLHTSRWEPYVLTY